MYQMRKEMFLLDVTIFNYFDFSLGARSIEHQELICSAWLRSMVHLSLSVLPQTEVGSPLI